jgi:hypothetical protein
MWIVFVETNMSLWRTVFVNAVKGFYLADVIKQTLVFRVVLEVC